MKGFIITGTSSGIGKSLCELLLEDNNNKVLGISRTQKIEHHNYIHLSIDLTDQSKIESIKLPDWENADQLTLIHNAGWVGPIKKIGNQNSKNILDAYMINIIAPTLLSNLFISTYSNISCEKVILSISSGAAKYAIPGWNTYCSSKAALDMLSNCIREEHENIISLSIAPGKVNTAMQKEIRLANEKEFPRLKEFQKYYQDGSLIPSKTVANKYKKIISSASKYLHINHISEV